MRHAWTASAGVALTRRQIWLLLLWLEAVVEEIVLSLQAVDSSRRGGHDTVARRRTAEVVARAGD